MQTPNITQIDSDNSCTLNRTFLNNFGKIIVLIFYADHNEQSKQLIQNINNSIPIFGTYDNVSYYRISAEKCPQNFKKFNIEKTPTIIFTQTDKKILHRSQDNDIGTMFDLLGKIAQQHKSKYESDKIIWHPKVKNVIQSFPFIAFIKGTPQNPKCGFTRNLLQIFKNNNIEYTFYDITDDEYMRYWTRDYSGWPTFPQLFINGKLIGGLDVTKQLIQKGQFAKMIPQSCKKSSPQQRYNNFIKQHETIVFVNGFTFQNKQTQIALQEAHKKYGDNITIYNVALDKNLQSYISENVNKKYPFVVSKQQLIKQ